MTNPASKAPQPASFTKSGLVVLLGLIVLLIGLFVIVAQSAVPANAKMADESSVFLVVGGVAVAIERAIEVMWTIFGLVSTNGKDWPLKDIGSGLKVKLDALDASLSPYYLSAKSAVTALANSAQIASDQEVAAHAKINDLAIQMKATQALVKKVNPDAQLANALVDSALKTVGQINELVPGQLDKDVENISQIIQTIPAFIDTFKDNPGRRLISICLGALLGLFLAGSLGLDLLAIATDSTTASAYTLLPHVGVALTGIVIGLGSAPTHEVIRAIQEYKKERTNA